MYLCSKSVSVPFVSSTHTSWVGQGRGEWSLWVPIGLLCLSLVTAELWTDQSHGMPFHCLCNFKCKLSPAPPRRLSVGTSPRQQWMAEERKSLCHSMWCLGVSPFRVTPWPEGTHAPAETFSMQVAIEIDSF